MGDFDNELQRLLRIYKGSLSRLNEEKNSVLVMLVRQMKLFIEKYDAYADINTKHNELVDKIVYFNGFNKLQQPCTEPQDILNDVE